jgi:hypothetical protein
MSTGERLAIHKGLVVARVIWAFFLGSLGVYLAVGLLVAVKTGPALDEGAGTTVRYVLYGVSLATLAVIRFLRGAMLRRPPAAGARMADGRHPVLARYIQVTVVSLALAESIGIHGLILAFLLKQRSDMVALVLLSAAAMIFYRPSRDELLALAGESDGSPRGF